MSETMNSTETEARSLEQLLDRGRALAAAGDIKSAARVYQLACIQHPFDSAPWVGAGLCQKRLGDSRAAELALSIAIALGADHPGVLVHHAECLVRLGKRERARADLDEALTASRDRGDSDTLARASRTLTWLNGQEATS